MYAQYNRTSDVQFIYNNTQLKTTWRYGDSWGTAEKNGVIYGVKYNGAEKLTYTYDALGRRVSSKINTSNPFVTEYRYKDRSTVSASTLLEKISYSNDRPYIYAYDANGNITSISTENNGVQTLLVSYIYDALNQLVRENNAERNKTIVYTYDNGGNLTSVKEYAYTTGAVSGTPITEKTYTYGNTEWKDLLTNYNGVDITYDAIGNPLNWTNGKTFTWTGGRQLSGVTDAANTITYTYDDSGIRTSKTVNGVKTDYYLNGTAIIMQKTGDNCIWYTYDESGNVSGCRYGLNEYYFYRNGQGDIIGIVNELGILIAKYSYDAWGNILSITGYEGEDVSGNPNHIANINPFRYRGYFYDTETGLYYLQSRYYDPQVGRFINADGYVSTGQDILCHNMFMYCANNPVNFADPSGYSMQDIVNGARLVIAIAAASARKNLPMEKRTFVVEIYASSLEIEKETNIPAAITASQAIYESGYGQKTPKDVETKQESYNLFGIKGSGTAGSVKCWTYEKNRTERILANFRAYNNFEESLKDHSNLLLSSRYSHLLGKNVEEWAYGLQYAGYCQDDDYGKVLMSIITSWDLI